MPPNKQSHSRRASGGAALVIALVLLLVLTILAFTGLNSSITENAMANNEQFRQTAAQASGTGIENAIANLGAVSTALGSPPLDSGWRNVGASTVDRYNTRSQYVGEERNLPQSSADRFVGLHFTIDSDGQSARNSRDRQTQGVLVVAVGDGNSDFGQLGSGLGP